MDYDTTNRMLSILLYYIVYAPLLSVIRFTVCLSLPFPKQITVCVRCVSLLFGLSTARL